MRRRDPLTGQWLDSRGRPMRRWLVLPSGVYAMAANEQAAIKAAYSSGCLRTMKGASAVLDRPFEDTLKSLRT